jgi:hypothetical protein
MALESKTPQPFQKQPFIADSSVRDRFIEIAFKELVAAQVADWKVNHEMAATLAVRYANAVMVARTAETAPLNVTVAKGSATAATPANPVAIPTATEPPKSIAEIIGEAEPVAEVK